MRLAAFACDASRNILLANTTRDVGDFVEHQSADILVFHWVIMKLITNNISRRRLIGILEIGLASIFLIILWVVFKERQVVSSKHEERRHFIGFKSATNLFWCNRIFSPVYQIVLFLVDSGRVERCGNKRYGSGTNNQNIFLVSFASFAPLYLVIYNNWFSRNEVQFVRMFAPQNIESLTILTILSNHNLQLTEFCYSPVLKSINFR